MNYTIDSLSNIVPVSTGNHKIGDGVIDFTHLLFYNLTHEHWLILDTFNDALEIVDDATKNSVFDRSDSNNPYWGYYCSVFHRSKNQLETIHADILKKNNDDKFNFFVICPTFNCNSRCIYCYQQYDSSLDRRTVSQNNLEKIFGYIGNNIKIIKNSSPQQFVAIGLFGGEPFIKKNKDIIVQIFDFARLNKIPVLPTTNLQEIEELLNIEDILEGYVPLLTVIRSTIIEEESL